MLVSPITKVMMQATKPGKKHNKSTLGMIYSNTGQGTSGIENFTVAQAHVSKLELHEFEAMRKSGKVDHR